MSEAVIKLKKQCSLISNYFFFHLGCKHITLLYSSLLGLIDFLELIPYARDAMENSLRQSQLFHLTWEWGERQTQLLVLVT